MKKAVFFAFVLLVLSPLSARAAEGERWMVVGVKREVLEDATFYDPLTKISGPIEGGLTLPSYCVVCLSDKASVDFADSMGAEKKFTQNGAVVDSLKKVMDGLASKDYVTSRIWVTQGTVETRRRLVINGKEEIIGGASLDGDKINPDGSRTANESTVTPCGFEAKRFVHDPCPRWFEEMRDHIKRKMPKPADLHALDSQKAEKDTLV